MKVDPQDLAGSVPTHSLPQTKLSVHQLPMFLMFLAGAQFFLGILEPFFSELGFGEAIVRIVRHAHLAPLGVAFILVLLIPGALNRMGAIPRVWLSWVIAFMGLMFVMGMLRVVLFSAALLDAGAYGAFVVCVVVGSRMENWRWIDRYLRALFYLGAVIMASELLVIERAVRAEVTGSVAYQIRAILFAWPYMLLTIALAKRGERIVIASGLVMTLIMCIVFQKRAPTVRFTAALLIFVAFLPGVTLRRRGLLRFGAILSAVIVFAATLSISASNEEASNIVSRSSAALAGRFQTITSEENERWVEAGYFFDDVDGLELAAGKGFGGAVRVPYSWPPGMDIVEDGRTYYGIYSMHIGLTEPLLKGGLLFWFLFFGGWMVFLVRFRRYKNDPRAIAAWGILLLNLTFMSVETLWGPGNVVLVMLLGFCVGYLAQRRFWETSQPADPVEPS